MKKTTKERILDAGVKLWPNITLQAIADEAKLTHPAILYHFPGVTLKREIIKHAIKTGESRIIVQLIAAKHPAIRGMSEADRIRHFNLI
jgi:AcrR family transcriptional regulator